MTTASNPIRIIEARHAGRCPLTGTPFDEGAGITPVGKSWVAVTPVVLEVLGQVDHWVGRTALGVDGLALAVALFESGLVGPPRERSGWLGITTNHRHMHHVIAAAGMIALVNQTPELSPLECAEWVALQGFVGWDEKTVAVWFMAAGHDLSEARTLLAGGPLTDELRATLTVEALLSGWSVDAGLLDRQDGGPSWRQPNGGPNWRR